MADKRITQKDVLISGFSGGIAGIVVDFVYYPLESIKTRIQASTLKLDYSKLAQNLPKYKGFLT
jgi:solute carrier family 25 S-adenosylmethionine transporter 26